jgi:hypothetical protein
MKSWNGTLNGSPYTAHLATIVDPRFFRFEVAPGGIPHLAKVSETAVYR